MKDVTFVEIISFFEIKEEQRYVKVHHPHAVADCYVNQSLWFFDFENDDVADIH